MSEFLILVHRASGSVTLNLDPSIDCPNRAMEIAIKQAIRERVPVDCHSLVRVGRYIPTAEDLGS